MQTCSKCNLPLTILEGEYQDYTYCPSCLSDVIPIYIQGCCKMPDIKAVRAVIANGTVQIREQCQHCRRFRGPAISQAKFQDTESLPKVEFLSYENQIYFKTNEHKQMKAYIDRLRDQQETNPLVFESASDLQQHNQTAYSTKSLHTLQHVDWEEISSFLDSVHEVFVDDWSFTLSMLTETDGWSYDNSPFTTQEQNWSNMTELTKRYLKVRKILLQLKNLQ